MNSTNILLHAYGLDVYEDPDGNFNAHSRGGDDPDPGLRLRAVPKNSRLSLNARDCKEKDRNKYSSLNLQRKQIILLYFELPQQTDHFIGTFLPQSEI